MCWSLFFSNTSVFQWILCNFKNTYFEDHPAYGCFWPGIQKLFVFSFSKNVFYLNQTFLRLDSSLFSLRDFDEVLKRAFLNFLFTAMLYQCHRYTFFNQLRSGPSPQGCLYFKISRAQSYLTFALYFDRIKEIWVYSRDFSAYVIDILFTISQRSKQFLWNS